MNIILMNKTKFLLIFTFIISLSLLASCDLRGLDPLTSNGPIQIKGELLDNEGKYDLAGRDFFNGKTISDYDLEIIEDGSDSFILLPEDNPQYLVPLNNAQASLRVTRKEDEEFIEIPIEMEWSEDLFINSQVPNNLTENAFSAIASNRLVKSDFENETFDSDLTIETIYHTVLIYRNDDFLGIIGELPSTQTNASITLTKPGRYTMRYLDEDSDFIEYGPFIIEAKPLDYIRISDYQYVIQDKALSSLNVIFNDGDSQLNPGNAFNEIGENEIKIEYVDRFETVEITEAAIDFTIEPEIEPSRTFNFDPDIESYRLDRPLTLTVKNQPTSISVNGEETQDRVIPIRSVGETLITIEGHGGYSRTYTFNYTNTLQDDIFEYWYVYLAAAILAVTMLVVKVPKAVK